MSGYDAWLERPYQEAYAEEEAYQRVIDELELTPEVVAIYDFEAYFAMEAETAGADRYEAYMEDMDFFS